MDEAEIGEKSMVAASAFVRAGMKVPPRSLVAGVPAKVMRELSEEEIQWKLEGTLTYQDLTRRCLASMTEVQPLARVEPERPRVKAPEVQPLIAAKRK
jgi:phenylacetic acid degradation protein